MDDKHQFCSFFVDDLLCGIAVEQVQEVAGAMDMTPVPLAPSKVGGLINLRGQIVTAIDLRTCLGLGDRSSGQIPLNVILHTDTGYTSLLVDGVGEIVEVDDDAFELPPETLRGRSRDLILGSYKLSDRLMHVLNIERTIEILS
jgi:purine-binding chemotaxis protein CheW